MLCTKFGSNICYSHRDRRTYASDIHLMTSRELTSGFDFWSRGHLRTAVIFGADIFIQSGVIGIFPKFKMAEPPSWIERLCEFGHSGVLIVWYLCSVPNLAQISLIVTEIDIVILQIFSWWRHANRELTSCFDFWSRGHLQYGRGASFHKIWYIYLYPIWSYWHFPEIKDGGRRHLGFVGGSHIYKPPEGVFVVHTPCKNFVVIGYSFQVIGIWIFCRSHLKVLFTPQKFQFFGVSPPKFRGTSFRSPNDTSLRDFTSF